MDIVNRRNPTHTKAVSINPQIDRDKSETIRKDEEAIVLARCYALLIRKAKERRARLAAEATAEDVIEAVKSEDNPEVATDETENR